NGDRAGLDTPCFPALARWGCRHADDEIRLTARGNHDRRARVWISLLWRKRDYAPIGDTGERVRVRVGLLTRRADDREGDQDEHSEHCGNDEWNGPQEKRAEALGPTDPADDARAAMSQHDPRAQIARRIHGRFAAPRGPYPCRANRRGFVERVLERRELTRALIALRDVRRDRLPLAFFERSERVGRKVLGRMAIHRH